MTRDCHHVLLPSSGLGLTCSILSVLYTVQVSNFAIQYTVQAIQSDRRTGKLRKPVPVSEGRGCTLGCTVQRARRRIGSQTDRMHTRSHKACMFFLDALKRTQATESFFGLI